MSAGGELTETKKGGEPVAVVLNRGLPIPDPPAGSHPIAVACYEALKVSGQAIYYEPSDWAGALLWCAEASRYLTRPGRGSSEYFSKIFDGYMRTMLGSENERRRVRIEIERKTGVPMNNVTDDKMAEYRRRREQGA